MEYDFYDHSNISKVTFKNETIWSSWIKKLAMDLHAPHVHQNVKCNDDILIPRFLMNMFIIEHHTPSFVHVFLFS